MILFHSYVYVNQNYNCYNAGSTAFLLNNYYWILWSLGCKQGGNVVLHSCSLVLVTKGWNSFSFSLVLVDKPIFSFSLVTVSITKNTYSFVLV